MIFRAFLLAGSFAALPFAAWSQCNGPSIIDRFSVDQQTAFETQVAETRFGEGLVWKAIKDGQEITLAGTMHIYDPRIEDIAARMAPYLDEADHLMVEMTLDDQKQMQREFTANPSRIYITEGPTLIDLLPPATWERVKAAATARNIPAFMVAKMQPWFAIMTLGIPACAMADMASGRAGVDGVLMKEAEARNIPTTSVESWEAVLAVFAKGSMEEQLAAMESSLLPSDIEGEVFVAMLDGYTSGRVAEVWHLSRAVIDLMPLVDQDAARAAFDEMEQDLLISRNRAWLPVILEQSKRTPNLMVAVGAAHLVGDVGLLALLESDGWSLARTD